MKKKLKILELFAGTRSIGKAFEENGHEAAPRGSRTGTQALKGSVERSKIPVALCRHIVDICENPSNSMRLKKELN